MSQFDIAKCLAIHGLGNFTLAMIQGFSIPMVASAKLALTAHVKTVGHSFLLMGTAAAVGTGAFTMGATFERVTAGLLVGGCYVSFVGDVLSSVTAVGLPLAAKAAGKGTKCDPAETDYSIEDKYKRTPGSGAPALSTVLQKLSAIAMAAGGALLLSAADFSKAY
mmetsp:Transcript_30690/g.53857  ORF Transcript_30690/g.53857 Transcript_30690/m.53857 type:complete len:165 (+) Transcript_30690:84-578(+)|eukprot:CAMPEP_0197521818 /NCGR_PEP_ID=MMETSP1318-20131121/7041_1 /TAXON_ID=552666 /ORGANISM="Partenskyella glossopodia, Strain RCC365" /LENGTH=164 /DNA_ID=CAMNT_0043073949 /DNA_START=35 /DNA_END=529 /DNA_ORIENTATION=-